MRDGVRGEFGVGDEQRTPLLLHIAVVRDARGTRATGEQWEAVASGRMRPGRRARVVRGDTERLTRPFARPGGDVRSVSRAVVRIRRWGRPLPPAKSESEAAVR